MRSPNWKHGSARIRNADRAGSAEVCSQPSLKEVKPMENKKSTEAKGDTIMKKEEFAALWKSIRLKVTDTYDVPPEILWVNGSTIGTLGNFSASTGKAKSKKTSLQRH